VSRQKTADTSAAPRTTVCGGTWFLVIRCGIHGHGISGPGEKIQSVFAFSIEKRGERVAPSRRIYLAAVVERPN